MKSKHWIRRSLSLCIALIVMLVNVLHTTNFVFADSGFDNTAPVINKMAIHNANAVDTSKGLEVSLDVTEDGVGISWIQIEFKGVESGQVVSIDFMASNEEGRYPLYTGLSKISIPFEDRVFYAEQYTVEYVFVFDANGNVTRYYAGDGSEFWKNATSQIIVTKSTHTDRISPELKELSISNAENLDVSSGVFPMKVTVVEEGSGINYISLMYEDKEGNGFTVYWSTHYIYPDGRELRTGTHQLNAELSCIGYTGTYNLTDVLVEDFDGNKKTYTKDSKEWSHFTQKLVITKAEFTQEDRQAPTIENIQLKNVTLVTPDILSIPMTINTGKKGASWISIDLKGSNGDTAYLTWDTEKPVCSGQYTFKFPLGTFWGSGMYQIESISIMAPSGAGTTYTSQDLQAIPGYQPSTIQVKSGFDIAYYGATSNVDAVVKAIMNMKEGQTAVIDYRNNTKASKQIFDAIAGKDKKVVFENDDVQWVFDGKTIDKSKCKTIDLEVLISKQPGDKYGYPDDKYILYMKFANNGVLPGPADMRINNEYLKEKYKVESDMILSYYDSSATVLDKSVECAKDGYAEFNISHNSVYILSAKMPRLLAPKGLKATCQSGSKVNLSWKSVIGANGYDIYRATSKNGSYKKVQTIKSGKTVTWTDTTVTVGKTYYYKMKARAADGKVSAAFSSIVSSKIQLGKVTGLKVSSNKNKKVKLQWKEMSGATGYRIYISTSAKGKYKLVTIKKGQRNDTTTVSKLKKGKTYYFKVVAYKVYNKRTFSGYYSEVLKVRVK